MWFIGINRDQADKAFRTIKSVYSTASLAVGNVVAYDVATFDGVRVTRPATANLALAAGVVAAVIANGEYGKIQTWGYNADNLVDGVTSLNAGDPLAITNGSFNLTLATAVTNAAGSYLPAFAAGVSYTTGAAAAKAVMVRCI